MKTSFTGLICLLSASLFALNTYAASLQVGVAWEGKSGMADRVLQGMQQTLKDGGAPIELEIKKELKDVASLEDTVNQFEKDKSAVVLMRSTGAKFFAKKNLKIPGFFGACNDPVELGVLKSAESPDKPVTGVTYAIAYQTQLETIRKLFPKAKSLLLIVQEGHPGSPLEQAGTKSACEKMGLQYSEKVCKTKEEALASIKEAEGKVDFAVLGAEALLIDNGGEIAKSTKIPCASYSEKAVIDGALCGVVADDIRLGNLLAQSLVEVLVNKKAIKEVPVVRDPKPQFVINAKTVERLGLDIPFQILENAKILQ